MSTLKTTNVQHPSAADPAIELDAAGKLWLAGGKILQVVRATDTTERTTTSTSFVDANLSVTITPQKSDSAIILRHIANVDASVSSGTIAQIYLQITDSSNNALSGAELCDFAIRASAPTTPLLRGNQVVEGYSTPATTSPVTYKARFAIAGGACTATLKNNFMTGQLFAIEVSA